MLEEISPVPTAAGPPFDKATADVILRSSDQIDFLVHKSILLIASPVFETLFSLPQGESNSDGDSSTNSKDGLQVVQIAQNGATLGDLLAFYYPVSPKLDTLKKVVNLLHAANYYQIDDIVSHLRGLMSTPYFLEKQPMRVYAIAWRWGWKDVVEKAALQLLRRELKFSELPFSGCEEMKDVPANALLHLFEYHQICGEAAKSAVDGNIVMWTPKTWARANWSRSGTTRRCESECDCADYLPQRVDSGGDSYIAKKWWCDYLEEVQVQLRKKPCKATILSRAYPSIAQAEKCGSCSNYIKTGVYYNGLVPAVEEAIGKVPLEFGMLQQ